MGSAISIEYAKIKSTLPEAHNEANNFTVKKIIDKRRQSSTTLWILDRHFGINKVIVDILIPTKCLVGIKTTFQSPQNYL
jgi:hypothetical protein